MKTVARLLGVCGLAAALGCGSAAAAAPAPRSIWDGVYAAEQVQRGERVVRQSCLLCHVKGNWSGAAFLGKWSGQPLSRLYDFISTRMPLDNPGKLSAAQYADAMAYILEANGAPAGAAPLTGDARTLRVIAITTAVGTPAAHSDPLGDGPTGGSNGKAGAGRAPRVTWVFRSDPIGDGPWVFDTAQYRIRVSIMARLENPWSIAFLPGGDMLITERPGRLRVVRGGVLDPMPVAGLPTIYVNSVAGLMDVVLHPDYPHNHRIYLSYCKEGPRGRTTAVASAVFDGATLADVKDVLVADAWFGGTDISNDSAFGSRLAFDKAGFLHVTVGDRDLAAPAQAPGTHAGKILRLRDDGSVPDDNPFIGKAGFKPEIYSLGHRNPQGLAFHPQTGELWSTEHGPQGGDELNVIKAGRNYGWPLASFGRNYDGSLVGEGYAGIARTDLTPPLVYWVPSIAPSGLALYQGERFADWRGNAFVGGMRQSFQQNTGHIERLTFNDKGLPIAREPLLRELKQRIRDIREGPDGLLYVVTDEPDGVLLKIEPAD